MVGVGTWDTQAEFKEIKVAKDGRTLFASDFSRGSQGWKLLRGDWQVQEGSLRQTSREQGARALAGDLDWSDYTLTLKARKLGGNEGFLVLFQSPGDETTSWWNLGGWRNSQHGMQVPGFPEERVPGRIETGRWYDIKVELSGLSIRGYLDGQLVQEVSRPAPKALYAVATRDEASREIILKVVNVSAQPRSVAVALDGINRVAPQAVAVVLTGPSPQSENSLEDPRRVAPQTWNIDCPGPRFTHIFPAYSLTVLRLKER